MVITATFGWAIAFTVPHLITTLSGRAARTLYSPSGRSTPPKRGYSMAESLVMRGLYDDGIAAYRTAIAEDPTDSTPYIRIARIYRDRMSDPEQAAAWFSRALREPEIGRGTATLVRRELVELYEKMGRPERAAPLLARTAEELAGEPEGDWAAEALARIKKSMAGEADSE